jgi:hypothetical protein
MVVEKSLACLLLAGLGLGVSFAQDIKYAEPRPMMKLAGELVSRYKYLVTYEDAPYEASDVVARRMANRGEYRSPRWAPVTFHVQARAETDGASPAALQAGAGGGKSAGAAAAVRPLGPDVIRPLIAEYNSSGNPGRFDAIYDGDYAHIVPAGREDGRDIDRFEPMLSTVVPVNLSEGTCWDLLSELFNEVQQNRRIPIAIFAAPVAPMKPGSCTIRGHGLPARQVLIQLLEEIGAAGRGTKARFAWTLVYDPTSAGYVFCTDMVQDEPLYVPLPVPADAPATGSRFAMPAPVKKQ